MRFKEEGIDTVSQTKPKSEKSRLPLSKVQITAANWLHGRLSQWKKSDDALVMLKRKLPEFDGPTTLLKVAAINTLYGTNVFAVVKMAEHVTSVMANENLKMVGPEFVDRLAAFRINGKTKMFRSFASKFAHFFIDAERFPIWDKYSVRMVKRHLGPAPKSKDKGVYESFAERFNELKDSAGHTGCGRELDRYLWLAGIRLAMRKGRTDVNVEVREMFESLKPQVKRAMERLGCESDD